MWLSGKQEKNDCHPTAGFQKSKPLGEKIVLEADTNDLEEI